MKVKAMKKIIPFIKPFISGWFLTAFTLIFVNYVTMTHYNTDLLNDFGSWGLIIALGVPTIGGFIFILLELLNIIQLRE